MDKKKETKTTKSSEEILFPEARVGDVVIKPWSFGKLFELSPLLEKVLDKVEEKNIMDMFEESFISYTSMARAFTIASTEILGIMVFTLDIGEDEIKNLSMEDGVKIAMIIYNQNKEKIKNAFTPLLS